MKSNADPGNPEPPDGTPPPEPEEFTRMYLSYKNEFLRFAYKNFRLQRTDAEDVYQECFIALHRNIASGRLSILTCSPKTYLFRIARNVILKNKRDRPPGRETEIPEDLPDTAHSGDEWMEKEETVCRIIREMGDPCKKVLTLFYREQKSMSDIAREMNYRSPQVAKNRKNLCIKQLRKTLERASEEGYG